MKVLDLFSGIGGFSLGLDRAGMETVAFCEIEEYPRSILKKHWPDVPIHEDIRKLDGKQYKGTVGLVCGGFPCQPFSVAGKQKGKEDDRHLWPEMLRIIKEIQPEYVIGENVAGFITMALDDVLLDLENEGYTSQSFVIPACAVGGIHRRDRVWIVANKRTPTNTEHNGTPTDKNKGTTGDNEQEVSTRQNETKQLEGSGISSTVADASSFGVEAGLSGQNQGKEGIAKVINNNSDRLREGGFVPIELPTQSPVRNRDDGLSNNVARLKALGNSVVPQIPELIGRAIMAANK